MINLEEFLFILDGHMWSGLSAAVFQNFVLIRELKIVSLIYLVVSEIDTLTNFR